VIDEEVGGSDPHDPPALSLEVFPTLDVDTPLTSIHPVPIALVFEGDTSGWDAEVRMKTQPAVGELHWAIHLDTLQTPFLEQKAQEAFRTGIGTETDPRERPRTRSSAFRPAELSCHGGKLLHLDERRSFARTDQVVAGGHEIVPPDHAGELAPDMGGGADGKPLEDCADHASEAVPDHATTSRWRARKRDGNVQRFIDGRPGKRNAEQRSRRLMAELRAVWKERKVRPTQVTHGAWDGRNVDGVKGMVEITGTQSSVSHSGPAGVVGGERDFDK